MRYVASVAGRDTYNERNISALERGRVWDHRHPGKTCLKKF